MLTSDDIKAFLKKYQPGKVTALPPMMNHQASQLSLLRQLQNRTNMTRREITENRIIQNILIHNDPKDVQIHDDLFISTRSFNSEHLFAPSFGAVSMHQESQLSIHQPAMNPSFSLAPLLSGGPQRAGVGLSRNLVNPR